MMQSSGNLKQKKRLRINKKIILILLLIFIICVFIAGVAFFKSVNNNKKAKNDVESVVETYFDASKDGNLNILKQTTTGNKNSYYSNFSNDNFREIYEKQKNFGEIYYLDEIVKSNIDGNKATVEIVIHKDSKMNDKITTIVKLQKVKNLWKVTD